jgi:hypothetical protein
MNACGEQYPTCSVGPACDGMRHDPLDVQFWGQCEHGVSLSPAVECEQCEVREDDCDA